MLLIAGLYNNNFAGGVAVAQQGVQKMCSILQMEGAEADLQGTFPSK